MRFSNPESSGVCMNVKTDAVQIDFAAVRNNDINATELEAIAHLELYGASLYDGPAVDVLHQVMKFKNLDTLSLLIPRDVPDLAAVVRLSHGRFAPSNYEIRLTFERAVGILRGVRLSEYNTWRRLRVNYILTDREGRRSTREL
ncbi:hypothetical protein VE03_01983 [Pseudogymnoascus sp. 23342-1-I1]|nr:hypothetical protein VE03_01983 [Pseudogymnoascus sp. 23342-1-I1]